MIAPFPPRTPFTLLVWLLCACSASFFPTGVRADVAQQAFTEAAQDTREVTRQDTASVVRWNLRTGLANHDKLTGGDLLRVKIEGMNPRCWSYEIAVEATELGDDLGAVIDALEIEGGAIEDPPQETMQVEGGVDRFHTWRASVAELSGKAVEVRTTLCDSDGVADTAGLRANLATAASSRRSFTAPEGDAPHPDSVTALLSRHAEAEHLARRLLALSAGSAPLSELTIPTSHRTTAVHLEVKATRRDDLGLEPSERIVEANLLLQPAYRIVVSAGWMGSWLDENSFERTTIPLTGEDGSPETREHFVNRDRSSGFAHSPMVQLGVFPIHLGSTWMGVSIGLAARTINDIAAPEPFLGLSLLVGDVLVLSAGGHLGRIETLAKEIQDFEGDLPASVQTSAVIGSTWDVDWAITASVKVR
jgi:hypothetical protein